MPDEPRDLPPMPRVYDGARLVGATDPATLPPPEIKVARAWRVFCDGGEGALGHPRVFYSIPHEPGWIDCGYCDARFVHKDFEQAQIASLNAGQPLDHATRADVSGDVRGKQPGDGSADPFRGNDGGSGQHHGG